MVEWPNGRIKGVYIRLNADTVQVGLQSWRAPGNRPDAITSLWTELGYPRLVRLRVRGPDDRYIRGRVVTAGRRRGCSRLSPLAP